MPDPDETTPRLDHHAHITGTALTDEHGPHYATAIHAAAGLKLVLNASAPHLDLDDPDQLIYRTRLLWNLHGRVSAAAGLLIMTGQPDAAAAELAEMHVVSLAAAMEQDAKNQHSGS